jgi:uncharacterized protein (TIGR00730 family)
MINMPVKTITVYAASSSRIDPFYMEAARQLGTLLASYGITCINGGGNKGLMAAVTDGMLHANGQVIGIIPHFMMDEGWTHPSLSEIIATPDMHTRKQLMAQKSDACIALPGGIGTLEELLEIITWKQLGLYTKPIIILNIKGYYDELLAMLDKAVREQFMRDTHAGMWAVAYTPEEALTYSLAQQEWHENPRSIAAL